jgi:hypothetical protein
MSLSPRRRLVQALRHLLLEEPLPSSSSSVFMAVVVIDSADWQMRSLYGIAFFGLLGITSQAP